MRRSYGLCNIQMSILKTIEQHGAYQYIHLMSYETKYMQCRLHKLVILGAVGLGGQMRKYMHGKITTKLLKIT